MKEIGSEFSAELLKQAHTDLCWIPKHSDIVMTFSGRTAIETALRNIPQKKKALLPAWCCSSIVEPFLNQGMKVSFYPVEIAEEGVQIELQIPEDCDVVLLCRYFGFVTEYPKDRIIDFQKRGGIVIEDITHSLLSYKHSWEHSDYLVASLRKWGAVLDGGFAAVENLWPKNQTKNRSRCFLKKSSKQWN